MDIETSKKSWKEKNKGTIITVVWIGSLIIGISLCSINPSLHDWSRIVGFIIIGICVLSFIMVFIKSLRMNSKDA